MRIHEARKRRITEHFRRRQPAKRFGRVRVIARIDEDMTRRVEEHDLVAVEPAAHDDADRGRKVHHNREPS